MTDRPIDIPASRIPGLLRGDMTQYRVPLKRPKWAQEKGWPEQIMNEQDLDGSLSWFCKDTGCLSLLPVAQPGDRLWVREAHGIHSDWNGHDGFITYKADGNCWHTGPNTGDIPDDNLAAWFRTIDRSRRIVGCAKINRPSITMPRWASRITLTVTDLAVHRVQDISEEDAIAEGMREYPGEGHLFTNDLIGPKYEVPLWFSSAIDAFHDHWNATHGPGAWERNDWVLATTFRVDPFNIDQMERADA